MGISIQIAVEHHNMDAPIFLSPEAAEQIVRALRRRERRTMHYAVQLRQLHRLQGVAFKNMDVLRPVHLRVRPFFVPIVVIAGSDKHPSFHCTQRLSQGFGRLAVDLAAVEQVAGQKYQIHMARIGIIGQAGDILPPFPPARTSLFRRKAGKGAVQMKIRRM